MLKCDQTKPKEVNNNNICIDSKIHKMIIQNQHILSYRTMKSQVRFSITIEDIFEVFKWIDSCSWYNDTRSFEGVDKAIEMKRILQIRMPMKYNLSQLKRYLHVLARDDTRRQCQIESIDTLSYNTGMVGNSRRAITTFPEPDENHSQ